MSWVIPLPGGGFRIYTKGASEIVLSRCSSELVDGESQMSDSSFKKLKISFMFILNVECGLLHWLIAIFQRTQNWKT